MALKEPDAEEVQQQKIDSLGAVVGQTPPFEAALTSSSFQNQKKRQTSKSRRLEASSPSMNISMLPFTRSLTHPPTTSPPLECLLQGGANFGEFVPARNSAQRTSVRKLCVQIGAKVGHMIAYSKYLRASEELRVLARVYMRYHLSSIC